MADANRNFTQHPICERWVRSDPKIGPPLLVEQLDLSMSLRNALKAQAITDLSDLFGWNVLHTDGEIWKRSPWDLLHEVASERGPSAGIGPNRLLQLIEAILKLRAKEHESQSHSDEELHPAVKRELRTQLLRMADRLQ